VSTIPEVDLPSAYNSFDVGHGNVEQAQGNEGAEDLTAGMQNLQIANNPFLNRQSTAATSGYNPFVQQSNLISYPVQSAIPSSGQNPFINPGNNSSASYGQRPSRRTDTPAGGQSAYSPQAQLAYGASAGFLLPPQANPGYGMQGLDRRSRRSQTPAVNSSQSQQIGGSICRPRTSQGRPQTAQGHIPSQSSEHS
jgi:hypothetical protein